MDSQGQTFDKVSASAFWLATEQNVGVSFFRHLVTRTVPQMLSHEIFNRNQASISRFMNNVRLTSRGKSLHCATSSYQYHQEF